mmetsp:Transcript_3572/g.2600  ORF Transcript_3572/g.2600 Transcript_3572/m.2600 type:complete len:147 (-) Transcript_3572:126-566(-)
MPFLALIVGPYSVKGKNDSLLKVFHLKKKVPFALSLRQVPCTGLRRSIISEIKKLFEEFKQSPDKINLNERWTDDSSKKDKLIASVKQLLKKNIASLESFDFQEEIVGNIKESEAAELMRCHKEQMQPLDDRLEQQIESYFSVKND